MKILMVCLGNICRSPLAEGILQNKAREKGLDWQVDSAGTSGWHVGEPPDSRSIAVAQKHGIDISGQRSRKFKASDFEKYDLIYVMDANNYKELKFVVTSGEGMKKVRLILNELQPGYNRGVPDPYYNNGFDKVYDMLNEACEKIVERYTT